MNETQTTAKPEVLLLNQTGFEILRRAVRLARDGGVKKLTALRAQLEEIYPDEKDQIELAISTWAKHAQENKAEGD